MFCAQYNLPVLGYAFSVLWYSHLHGNHMWLSQNCPSVPLEMDPLLLTLAASAFWWWVFCLCGFFFLILYNEIMIHSPISERNNTGHLFTLPAFLDHSVLLLSTVTWVCCNFKTSFIKRWTVELFLGFSYK